jgi:CheY-like chemotaxis protein
VTDVQVWPVDDDTVLIRVRRGVARELGDAVAVAAHHMEANGRMAPVTRLLGRWLSGDRPVDTPIPEALAAGSVDLLLSGRSLPDVDIATARERLRLSRSRVYELCDRQVLRRTRRGRVLEADVERELARRERRTCQ